MSWREKFTKYGSSSSSLGQAASAQQFAYSGDSTNRYRNLHSSAVCRLQGEDEEVVLQAELAARWEHELWPQEAACGVLNALRWMLLATAVLTAPVTVRRLPAGDYSVDELASTRRSSCPLAGEQAAHNHDAARAQHQLGMREEPAPALYHGPLTGS